MKYLLGIIWTFALAVATISPVGATIITPAFDTFSSSTGGKVNAGKAGIRTLEVAASGGVTVSVTKSPKPKMSIGVDSTVVKTSGDQTIGGLKTFSTAIAAPNVLTNAYIASPSGLGTVAVAVATIGTTTQATLRYSTDQTLSANLTVGSNIELVPENGAKIINGTYTVTYGGSTASWDTQKKFEGTGLVTITNGEVMPEWFGAIVDDAVDDSTPVQQALNASSNVSFLKGVYLIGGVYSNKDFVHLKGSGFGTILRRPATAGYIVEFRGSNMAANPPETGWLKQPIVEDLTLDGTTLTTGGIGLSLFGVWNGTFRNIQAFNLDKVAYLKGTGINEFTGFRYARGPSLGIPNYILYMDAADGYRNNDNHYHHNQTLANKVHVYARGNGYSNAGLIDGLFVDNNTFFAGERAVDATHLVWSNISHNRVFDQTKEGIVIGKSSNTIIDSNVVVRSGAGAATATYFDAIQVVGDSAYWDQEIDFRNGGGSIQITNNNIYQPSGHGISVDYSSHITVTGNNIYNPNCTIRTTAAGGTAVKLSRDAININRSKGGTIADNETDSNRQMDLYTSYPVVTHRYDIYLGTDVDNFTVRHKQGNAVWDDGKGNVLDLASETVEAVTNGSSNYLNEEFNPENITAWANSGTAPTVTADTTVAPDGTTTADTIALPAALSSKVASRTITVTAGDVFAYSIYLKASSNMIVEAQLTDNVGSTTDSTVTRWLVTTQWRRYVISHRYAASGSTIKFLIGNISGQSPSITFQAWGGYLKRGANHTIPYYGKTVLLSTMPTSGVWKPGDYVKNTGGGATLGWTRMTLGNGNILNTDWTAK